MDFHNIYPVLGSFPERKNNFLFFSKDLKRSIIDEALLVLVSIVIIPHSGWDPKGPGSDTIWSTVFRNSSGILRYNQIRYILCASVNCRVSKETNKIYFYGFSFVFLKKLVTSEPRESLSLV